MKKYIVPVVAFLMIGTIANAQTDKKTPPATTTVKPMVKKPMTAKPAPMTKMSATDTTSKHPMAMKRKMHPKTSATAPKKTAATK